MSKSIKVKNNTYLDSSGVTHNRETLKDILTKLTTFDNNIIEYGNWFGLKLYRLSKAIAITSVGNQVIYTLPSNKCRIKICNAWLYKTNSSFSNLVNWNADTKTNDFGVLYYNHDTGQIMMNVQDTGWLQLVVYYTIE